MLRITSAALPIYHQGDQVGQYLEPSHILRWRGWHKLFSAGWLGENVDWTSQQTARTMKATGDDGGREGSESRDGREVGGTQSEHMSLSQAPMTSFRHS